MTDPIIYRAYDDTRPAPFCVGYESELEAAERFAQFIMSTPDQSPVQSLLVFGQPGSGKSHCPEVLAYRLKVWSARVSCNGLIADFDEQTDAPQRLRGLQTALSQNDGPKLVALDELDALAASRPRHENLLTLSHWVMHFLGLEDGYMKTSFVIAITNNPSMLDLAVRDRLACCLYIPLPTVDTITGILAHHGIPHAAAVARALYQPAGGTSGVPTCRGVFRAIRWMKVRLEAKGIDLATISADEIATRIRHNAEIVPRRDVEEYEEKNHAWIARSQGFVRDWGA